MSQAKADRDMESIGARLRMARRMFGISQRELARRAGVTNGTISLIEQGRVSPSVGSLKKVLDGIPLSLADFFTLDFAADRQVFFRHADLADIALLDAQEDISYRLVGHRIPGKAMQMIHEFYQPGSDTGDDPMLQHTGEESGIVIRGEIEITVGEQRETLGPGDAYYFDSRLPHRFRNRGSEICEIISANAPPSF